MTSIIGKPKTKEKMRRYYISYLWIVLVILFAGCSDDMETTDTKVRVTISTSPRLYNDMTPAIKALDGYSPYSGAENPRMKVFFVNNSDYLKGKIEVKGPKHYKLFIDGQEGGGELKLAPEHHTFCIKYLAEPKDTDSISVIIDAPKTVDYTLDKQHPYMVHDLTDGRRVRGVSLSADGKYICVSYQVTERGGNSRWQYELRDTKKGTLIATPLTCK